MWLGKRDEGLLPDCAPFGVVNVVDFIIDHPGKLLSEPGSSRILLRKISVVRTATGASGLREDVPGEDADLFRALVLKSRNF